MVRIPHADVLHPWNLCEIFGYRNRKTLETLSVFGLQSFRPHVLAIADKIDAVDFRIETEKHEKILCRNDFSRFDTWIFSGFY